jgi:hypothetical protein
VKKSDAAVPNRQRRSCGLWHKINWTVDLVAFSLPPRIDKSSKKVAAVENYAAVGWLVHCILRKLVT